MVDYKLLAKIYTVLLAPAYALFFQIFITIAYLRGDWRVKIFFNRYGEGYFELVLFSITFLVTILGSYWYFQDLLSNPD